MAATASDGQTTPPVGAHVLTADGDEIGTVKEVRGTAFKVDAPMQQDYWLGDTCVIRASSDQVTLAFAKNELDNYRLSGPDDMPAGSTDAIMLLMHMHREAKQQFSAILGASDNQRALQMWQRLQPVLKVHEQMEEQYLYDPLRAQQGAESELGKWEPQHERDVEQVEALIASADTLDANSGSWRDQIRRIADTLSQHIAEEESTIFPRIQQVWSPDQLQRAGQQMQQYKTQQLAGATT
jgi:hemerythrin-like domain-containing protein